MPSTSCHSPPPSSISVSNANCMSTRDPSKNNNPHKAYMNEVQFRSPFPFPVLLLLLFLTINFNFECMFWVFIWIPCYGLCPACFSFVEPTLAWGKYPVSDSAESLPGSSSCLVVVVACPCAGVPFVCGLWACLRSSHTWPHMCPWGKSKSVRLTEEVAVEVAIMQFTMIMSRNRCVC